MVVVHCGNNSGSDPSKTRLKDFFEKESIDAIFSCFKSRDRERYIIEEEG